MQLADYRTLGRSGLVVSPLALGTMTFGTQRWGADDATSRTIFEAYVEAGGNFVDTADIYANGRSEELLGQFISDAGLRDRIVLATKAGFSGGNHPHAGGNGAKHMNDAVNASLHRLRTSHIDLYWLHIWDMVTPAEEILQTMTALVRVGKIRYWGISNAPAWFIAKISTLACAHALVAPIALQYEYSLVSRGIEAEHQDVAAEFGLAIQPWSPLAGGFLTGKYRHGDPANVSQQGNPELPNAAPDIRVQGDRLAGANPFGDTKFTERNWNILDTLREIADDMGAPPAEVALAWLIARPHVFGTLVGASKLEQFRSNCNALSLTLTDHQRGQLDEASTPLFDYPATLFTPTIRRLLFGGLDVSR